MEWLKNDMIELGSYTGMQVLVVLMMLILLAFAIWAIRQSDAISQPEFQRHATDQRGRMGGPDPCPARRARCSLARWPRFSISRFSFPMPAATNPCSAAMPRCC